MSGLIERVARAIDRAMSEQLDPTPGYIARAAIEAMREPSDAMHKAGNDEMDDMAAGNGRALCEHIWRKMIDAELVTPIPSSAIALSKEEIAASDTVIGMNDRG